MLVWIIRELNSCLLKSSISLAIDSFTGGLFAASWFTTSSLCRFATFSCSFSGIGL